MGVDPIDFSPEQESIDTDPIDPEVHELFHQAGELQLQLHDQRLRTLRELAGRKILPPYTL